MPTLSAWDHYVVTVSTAGVTRVYRNGSQVYFLTVGTTVDMALPNMFIGKSAYASDAYLKAGLSRVAVYNSVLSDARCNAHYTAGLVAETPGASLTGVGLLSATGRRVTRGGASLVGNSTLTASGAVVGRVTGSASLTGLATLTASGGAPAEIVYGSASLTGEGVLVASQYGPFEPARRGIGIRYGCINRNDEGTPPGVAPVAPLARVGASVPEEV